MNNISILPPASQFILHGLPIQCQVHFAQIYNKGDKEYFRKFDYGTEKNTKKYGSLEPPKYDFSLVKSKIRLYYGDQDKYLNEELMQILKEKLCNADLQYEIMRDYGHATFIASKEIKEFYSRIVKE